MSSAKKSTLSHRTEKDVFHQISHLEELHFFQHKIMSAVRCLALGGLCSISHCLCVKLYGPSTEGCLNEKRRSVAEFLIRLGLLQRV
jgi:hypothetical protein